MGHTEPDPGLGSQPDNGSRVMDDSQILTLDDAPNGGRLLDLLVRLPFFEHGVAGIICARFKVLRAPDCITTRARFAQVHP